MENNEGVKTLSLASLFEWRIDNRTVSEMVEPISSPEFYCPLYDGNFFACQLELHKTEDGKVISSLKLISCSYHEDILIRFTISCFGSEQNVGKLVVYPGLKIMSNEILSSVQTLGTRPFINYVIVKFFIELLAVDVYQVEQNDKNYRSDMEELLNSEKFSDLTLFVQGKTIKVHKVILAAKSSFFASKFSSREVTDKLDITDFEYDVIEEMVRFMYTGTSPRYHLMTEQILKVAAEYKVLGLTKLCIENLLEDLCVENAVDTLLIAYRCNVEEELENEVKELKNEVKELKNEVKDFVCRNLAEVKGTSGWQHLCENRDIIVDLFPKLGEVY